jgi:hypothetical protein
MFKDNELRSRIRQWPESTSWLFSSQAVRSASDNSIKDTTSMLKSRAFTDSGYVLLQSGTRNRSDAVSVLFDCAPLGMEPMAAHGHADALSFTLRIGGLPFFVDAGTYDYFSYPEWRQYFRSTAAHNTVEVDGKSQSEPAGPFLWRRQAQTSLSHFTADTRVVHASGSHSGYSIQPLNMSAARHIYIDSNTREISIKDMIASARPQQIRIHFHLDPAVSISEKGKNDFQLEHLGISCRFMLDASLTADLSEASSDRKMGWISAGYHQRIASRTIVAAATITGNATFTHKIHVSTKS